jgi:hypothetical protein
MALLLLVIAVAGCVLGITFTAMFLLNRAVDKTNR